jgi:FixJ family two-component response regulator
VKQRCYNYEALSAKEAIVSESDARADTSALVCIVADDISIRESLSSLLRSAGLSLEIFSSTEEFLTNAHLEALGCLIVDVQPGITDLGLQQELFRHEIEIATIFLTGYDDIPIALGAAKRGAVECLTKPLDDDYLLETVWSAVRRYRQPAPGRLVPSSVESVA